MSESAIRFTDDLRELGLPDWKPPGSFNSDLGIWVVSGAVETSFPESGVNVFMAVDDRSFWFDHRNRAIGQMLEQEVPEGLPFLEVGSGSGVVVDHIRRTTNRPVLSVEPILAGAIAVARRGVTLSFCGSIESMELPDSCMSAVGAFDVVEHLDEPMKFLGDCRRVLGEDGRLILTVPAYQWLWSEFDIWNGHVRRFSIPTLERLLKESGFSLERCTHLFAPLVIPAYVTRILLPKVRKPQAPGVLEEGLEEALAPSSKLVDRVLRAVHGLERVALRHINVPLGTSILVAAKAEK